MPTILLKDGFRFFFFLSEPIYKAPHIHVKVENKMAIFWLKGEVKLQKNLGLNQKELTQAKKIVIHYQLEFLRKYYELIQPKC